jgi:hypothetical protein
MTALVFRRSCGASGFNFGCCLLSLGGPFGFGEFLLLAVEPLVFGPSLLAFLRSPFGLESGSFSGAFGSGLVLLLAVTVLVFRRSFDLGLLLLAAEPFMLGLLLHTLFDLEPTSFSLSLL